jgi:hypothetical protein
VTATWVPPLSGRWALPPKPPHRRRTGHRHRWAVGVAVLALLIAGGAAAGTVRRSAPPAAGSLAAAVPGIEAFVQADRGLRYTHKVTVLVMSTKALTAYVRKADGPVGPDEEAEDQTYQALGLIDSWQAYEKHEQVFDSEDVVGLYVDGTDTVRVEATVSNPYTRSVLAHELTHALDDQHFPLDHTVDLALGTHAEDDPSAGNAFADLALPDVLTGVKGLLEGDAEHVRDDYLAQLTPAQATAEQQDEDDSSQGIVFDRDDDTLAPLTYLPYDEGVSFVRAVLAHGGTAALDQAFREPPTTTAQILHPLQYFADDGGDLPSIPSPGTPPGTVDAVNGSMGEAGLALVAYGSDDSEDVHDGLAAGWRGDDFTTSTDGDRACTDWTVALDTPDHATALAALIRARLPAAQVSTSTGGAHPLLAVDSCR